MLEDREETINIVRKLAEQFDFDKSYIDDEIKKLAKFVTVLELTLEHICGKTVNES